MWVSYFVAHESPALLICFHLAISLFVLLFVFHYFFFQFFFFQFFFFQFFFFLIRFRLFFFFFFFFFVVIVVLVDSTNAERL
jgi:hypothetical protein